MILFRQHHFILIFALLLAFYVKLEAQSDNFNIPPSFKSISVDDGLSQSIIVKIIQDQKGFMWFATWDGLNRYDGYNFKIFKHNPKDSLTIAFDKINTLLLSKDNDIWIGGNNGSFSKYNSKSGTFENYNLSHSINDDLNIIALADDENGVLWVGTTKGLFKFNIKTKEFSEFKYHNLKDPNANFVKDIYLDNDGNILLGTQLYQTGLFYLDFKSNINYHFISKNISIHFPYTLSINQITKNKKGQILLGAPHGLYQFNLEKWKTNRINDNTGTFITNDFDPFSIELNDKIEFASVFELNKNNEVLLGGFFYKGIRYYDRVTDKVKVLKYQETFKALAISSLFIDKSDNLWIGTNGGGIFKEEVAKQKFQKLSKGNRPAYPFKSSSIRAILEDSKKRLWIGGYDGLDILNPNGENFRHIKFQGFDKGEAPKDPPVWFVYEDAFYGEDIFWIGTELSGLFRYNLKTDVFDEYYLPFPQEGVIDIEPNRSIQSSFPSSMFRDKENQLWLTTHLGLEIFDEKEKIFKPIKIPDSICRGNNKYLYKIAESKINNDLLWIGSANCGLLLFDKKSEEIKKIRLFEKNESQEFEINVNTIYEDNSQNLFIGTNTGLIIIKSDPSLLVDSRMEIEKYFSTLNGLPNNVIKGVLEDSNGHIWISSNIGISELDIATSAIRNYDNYDGLQGSEFNRNAYFKSKEGQLYFGGRKGINIIDPNSIKINNNIPQIAFTAFKVLNKPYDIINERGIKMSISGAKSITLDHDQNIISFEFAALEYTEPNKNQYAYKLEGFNEDWINIGNKREAIYTNLDPGNYVFRVKASNNDGIWNEQGKSIKLIINPPWWKTTWAIFLWVSIFLFGIYYANQILSYRVKMKERVKFGEQQVVKLKELDQLKTNLFSNISHEFRTPLTLILNPLKSILPKIEKKEVKQEMDVVLRNANRLLQLVNQILDLSKLEAGKMKKTTTVGDMIKVVKVMVYSFDSLADNLSIGFQKQYGINTLITNFNKDHLEKIINNLLSNAFKYTPKGGKVKFSFEVLTKKRDVYFSEKTDVEQIASIRIVITDTGKGINEEDLPKIFERFYQADNSSIRNYEGTGIGLSLVKELTELHGGIINVKSEIGWGTEVIVELPLDKLYSINKEELTSGLEQIEAENVETATSLEKIDKPTSQNSIVQHENEKHIILIVEDNEDLRSYICKIVKDKYQVLEASNGREGLEIAVNQVPDLIVSDVMMPEMDGFELSKKLKNDQRTSHIPIILLTALSSKENKLSGLKLGVDEYLAKPFDEEELIVRIENLIQIRSNLQEYYNSGNIAWTHPKLPRKESDFLIKSKFIVEENMENDQFSVEDLANEVGMSRVQFYRKIKAITNHSTNHFIRSIRLEKAKELLTDNNYNVTEVAYMVGFSSQSYFTKSFQRHFGISPSTLSKNN